MMLIHNLLIDVWRFYVLDMFSVGLSIGQVGPNSGPKTSI